MDDSHIDGGYIPISISILPGGGAMRVSFTKSCRAKSPESLLVNKPARDDSLLVSCSDKGSKLGTVK